MLSPTRKYLSFATALRLNDHLPLLEALNPDCNGNRGVKTRIFKSVCSRLSFDILIAQIGGLCLPNRSKLSTHLLDDLDVQDLVQNAVASCVLGMHHVMQAVGGEAARGPVVSVVAPGDGIVQLLHAAIADLFVEFCKGRGGEGGQECCCKLKIPGN